MGDTSIGQQGGGHRRPGDGLRKVRRNQGIQDPDICQRAVSASQRKGESQRTAARATATSTQDCADFRNTERLAPVACDTHHPSGL